MLVRMTVPCCDFTEVAYRGGIVGAGVIARGATGRWCVVMYAGPEYVAEHIAAGVILTESEAHEHVAALGYPNYADF